MNKLILLSFLGTLVIASNAKAEVIYTSKKPSKISASAAIKAARAEKIANGETLRKGRPVNNNSKRQQRMAELAAKKASGTFKLGRPK